jgi:E3 ubiquitin-protein ligase RNF14
LSKVCAKLDDLWKQNQNTCILFFWISFLNDELFEYLDLNKNDLKLNSEEQSTNKQVDSRVVKQLCSSLLLKDYDKDQKELKFQSNYYNCDVCFMQTPGRDCMKFNKCEHVFCNECMKAYFETQIACGNVKGLICPQEKCDSQAEPAQV